MATNLEEFEVSFQRLNWFYWITGLQLTTEKPKSLFLGLITTWTVPSTFSVGVFFFYMIFFEDMTIFMLVQQIWAILALLQVSVRVMNRLIYWDDKDRLIGMYRDIYTRGCDKSYADILDTHLKSTNYQLKMILLVIQILFPPTASCYVVLPIITKSGELPTPSVLNGVKDTEWPMWIYYYLYVHYTINAYIVLVFVLADEFFFISNVIILSNRFAAITDILRLLDYEGERDRAKDRRIIKDGYLLHLELLDIIQTSSRYFNVYIIHVGLTLFIMAMLLFKLMEENLDLLTLGEYFAFICILLIPCVFSQHLTTNAERFYESIADLNWTDLHVDEQKMILLLLLRAQQPITLRPGGLFYLDRPLITTAVRMQASLCALLQNI